MNIARRLGKVNIHLSPKQIVLKWIKQVQQHDSTMSYLRELNRNPPNKTLCDEIAHSVEAQFTNESQSVRNRAITQSTREGLFLFKLARECSHAVLTWKEPFKDKRIMMLLCLENLCLREEAGYVVTPEHSGQCCDSIRILNADIRARAAAVATIEREYFDGQKILFIDAKEELDAQLLAASKLLAAAEKIQQMLAEKNRKTENATTPISSKTKHQGSVEYSMAEHGSQFVADWVALAKAATYAAYGEHFAAAKVAAGFLYPKTPPAESTRTVTSPNVVACGPPQGKKHACGQAIEHVSHQQPIKSEEE